MICSACDFDPDAVVKTSYTIILHANAQSLNVVGTNGKNAHAYRKARNRWKRLLQPYNHLPKATGHRRIHFTRFWGKGKRAFDYGNLVGGFKPLLDMLVADGHLVDDKPKFCSEYYRQYKAPDGKEHVVIVIEEM